MNKILIVGHPESGYREVESLLNACGMSRARPSRREGLTAEEIGTMLRKAYKAEPLHQLPTGRDIAQIDTSPVWHGMALDLLLGNIDQELWGWADPSSVYLLDYWKTLDQNITFILVYNSPETLLGSSEENGFLSEEELQQRVHAWQAYNAALLHFYYRNTERCLLVHARQVQHSADKYLQQVRARIGAPLAELTHSSSTENIAVSEHDLSDEDFAEDSIVGECPFDSSNVTVCGGTNLTFEQCQAGLVSLPDEVALEQHLAQAIVSQQPQVLQLYAELQSAANLPLTNGTVTGIPALAAWRGLAALRLQGQLKLQRAEEDKKLLCDELVGTEERLKSVQEELNRNTKEIERLTQEASAKADELAKQVASRSKLAETTREQKQENELLLLQLHQVQEELERFYLEAQQQKEKIKALQDAEKVATERAKGIEQLSQEKLKLASEKENFAKLATEREKGIEQLNQEKSKLTSEKDSLARLATEREKKSEELTKQLAKQTELAQSLEARLKKATSAPVVSAEVQQENDLLLRQLHQVQEELERYYIENQRLKKAAATPAKASKPAYYGAADRVKAQLSYRLGYLMVQRSRSVGGLVTLPWALLRETQQFRRAKSATAGKKLPPLHQYRDAAEGDKVKQHLSYRLGSTLIKNAKSPIGWAKLPFAFRRDIKEFRQHRKQEGRLSQ
ncbi:hypothetical protein GCM10027343_01620 [Noviherbaspirillum agri]